jgi:hypothetical protein
LGCGCCFPNMAIQETTEAACVAFIVTALPHSGHRSGVARRSYPQERQHPFRRDICDAPWWFTRPRERPRQPRRAVPRHMECLAASTPARDNVPNTSRGNAAITITWQQRLAKVALKTGPNDISHTLLQTRGRRRNTGRSGGESLRSRDDLPASALITTHAGLSALSPLVQPNSPPLV